MSDELTERCRAREIDPSYHVDYTINDDGCETENLTHTEVVDSDEIDERGDRDCGWIAQLDDEVIELLAVEDPESGWTLHHKLTIRTAEQLSDMFACVARAARQRMIANALIREAEEFRLRELDARQGNLPLGE